MTNSQNRIFGYDLIKAIAIFMIVFYHMGGLDYGKIESDEYYIPNFNKFLLSFCASSVPLFLMVNGALVLPRHLAFKDSCLKAMRMLFLLIFGKIVLQYIVLEKCFRIEEEMAHFWFLGTLGIIYILSFFLNQKKWIKSIILILLIIYPFITNLIFDFIVFFHPDTQFYLLGHDGFLTLYTLVYFYLGYYIKDFQIRPIYAYLLIIIGLILINFEVIVLSNYYHFVYDGVNGSFPTIGAMMLSAGIFFRFLRVTFSGRLIRGLISLIGRNTLGIYLFHVLVIFLMRKYFYCEPLNLVFVTILSCCIILFSALFYNLLKSLFRSFIQSVNQEKF